MGKSRMFANLPIKAKVTAISIILCVLTAIVGTTGVIGLLTICDEYQNLSDTATARKELCLTFEKEVQAVDKYFHKMVVTSQFEEDEDLTQQCYDEAVAEVAAFRASADMYEKNASGDSLITEEARQKLLSGCEGVVQSIDKFEDAFENVYQGCIAGEGDRVAQGIAECEMYSEECGEYIAALTELADKRAVAMDSEAESMGVVLIIVLIAVVIFSVILGAVLATIIANGIAKSIKNIADASGKIAKGNFNVDTRTNLTNEVGQLSNNFALLVDTFKGISDDMSTAFSEMNRGNTSARIEVNRYDGEYRNIAENINQMLENTTEDLRSICDCVEAYAGGNFGYECPRFPGRKAIIHESFDVMRRSLGDVTASMGEVIDALNAGNLDISVPEDGFEGGWRRMVSELNNVVVTVREPIKVTKKALGEISKGNVNGVFVEPDKFNGEFNEMLKDIQNSAEVLSGYIMEISSILQTMANQNLDVEITHDYVGDFSEIQTAIELIVENFNQLVKEIIFSSEQVAIGSSSIADSASSLAQGASEQASAIEQLTATIGDVADKTKANEANVLKSTELANTAKQSADRVRAEMKDLLRAMEEISESSNNISNILKAIDDVAFQTNILALNAAVEAARAGEHGKGFAVVAEEVRNLAARSQSSAKESSDLITESLEKVEQGNTIANRTADVIKEIAKQIEEIAEISSGIAEDSREQTVSIGEINIGINQIATVVSNNTATSEESAAASEELASQSSVFKETVSKFTVRS